MQDSDFGQEFRNTLDKCVALFDQYMVLGDLNYDLLCETKGKSLLNIMELFDLSNLINKSRKENPQKLTQLSSRSHLRHLVGKGTAQKDITIDTTSGSQVNSNFPNRWSPASLTFNNYF